MVERAPETIHVSALPAFDFDRALLAREVTSRRVIDNFSALRAAATLWLYNSPDDQWENILEKAKHYQERERVTSESSNPLPTIGWEVESPAKLYSHSLAPRYAIFFDLIGMPRNKNHTGVIPGDPYTYTNYNFWEFSTYPSYTAAVAKKTLHELIKGGFIPYLEVEEGKATPEDRRNLLSDKLVSLHINLGVPDWLVEFIKVGATENPDLLMLASAFELAFSSSERLSSRNQNIVFNYKSGEKTNKQITFPANRIEIKALEVSDSSTYRLMAEIQLVATATFCFIAKTDSPLTPVWGKLRRQLAEIYQERKIEPVIIKDKASSSQVVSGEEGRRLQKSLRRVLTAGAHDVSEFTGR